MTFPAGDRFVPPRGIEMPAPAKGPELAKAINFVSKEATLSGEFVSPDPRHAFAPVRQSFEMRTGPLKIVGGPTPPPASSRPPAAPGVPLDDQDDKTGGYQVFCMKCEKLVATIPIENAVSQMVPQVVCASCQKPPSITEDVKRLHEEQKKDIFEYGAFINEIMSGMETFLNRSGKDGGLRKSEDFKVAELTQECEALARTVARLQNEIDRLRAAK